ncbi:conserved hypothetical protein [Borreliella burgdorferi 29805]|uniref:Uncharacterized protein n=2 Tax=Borreliella burgdorferi TaxID=139 RepID=A0A7U8EYD8_BORBG|nr:conserved hypothetical protein [Borreliella burgdorferi ZS7]ADQ29219.1 conserved hypothetical protein [Borreliella burgdorferi N40]ADQ30715.1 conserved hypothetical protein [Borreliella burgdorferi JD1]EEC22183.1 conserved hypothetical protein [Borreliella burgdorferi 156a]EEE18539.1 conserved hypothetical protein [Borreliella burgdorferi 72a]EEG98796.1 conserved hypothetical protein [Borreliella burgdorferi 118a]EEH31589.1 conserved hypothetical protein [Borreliella burgdorferi Bol26]EEH
MNNFIFNKMYFLFLIFYLKFYSLDLRRIFLCKILSKIIIESYTLFMYFCFK